MKVAIIGGGIAGLGLALNLHARGIDCEVFESVPEVKEMGVGITLLPHATRELAALGVLAQLEAVAIENLESVFFNRFGQFVYKELRGRHDGYSTPELGIHRGKLHRILFETCCCAWALTKCIPVTAACVWIRPSTMPASALLCQTAALVPCKQTSPWHAMA